MKKTILLIMILCVLVLAGCVPQAHEAAMVSTELAGFWSGLWHGMILVITFIWSLFDSSVTIYETNNNGNWYNFGFVLGISSIVASSR